MILCKKIIKEKAMDFRQLENFIEVAEHMSFTRAASTLYISQQGVSKSIRALEGELGVPLFYRTSSSISLTNYGVILLEMAKKMDKMYSDTLEMLSAEKRNNRSKIRIGICNGAVNYLPFNLLAEFSAEHPGTELDIEEGDDYAVDRMLLDGTIDIGFCTEPIDEEKLIVHHSKVNTVYFMLGENHPLANEESIDLRQMKDSNFITFGTDNKGHMNFIERCHKAGFSPKIGIVTKDMSLIKDMIRRDMGVGIYVGKPETEIPGIRLIPDKLHGWEFKTHICTSTAHGMNSEEDALLKILKTWK